MTPEELYAVPEIENLAAKITGEEPQFVPTLRADNLNLKQISEDTLKVLCDINNPPFIFRHTDQVCHVDRSDDGALLIKPFTDNSLRHLLSRRISWVSGKKKPAPGTPPTNAPALPPIHVVRDILAMPDPPFPVLNRIVRSPIFAAGGALLQDPGYSPISRTFYDPPKGFNPRIVLNPSDDNVAAARTILDDLFADFPFTGPSERTHAMALLLLPFARELIDGPTPLHLIEKPSPGTGAGLLTETISTVFLGHSVATMTEGRDEDEWRKRITSKLVIHNDLIVIDNIQHRLESSNLSAALTSEIWEDRMLGKTAIVRVPVKMTWIANGNNPSLSNEISRRTIRIRLDSKVDRPWLRESFRHTNLREYVAENRELLVSAVLTLIQNWVVKGKPQGSKSIGSYERWSKVIGGILTTSGYENFLNNIEDLYAASDSEGEAWRTLIERWWTAHKGASIGISELFALASPLEGDPVDINLGKGTEQSQKVKLGVLLKQMRDRQFKSLGNRQLRISQSDTKRHGALLWLLKDVTSEPWDDPN